MRAHNPKAHLHAPRSHAPTLPTLPALLCLGTADGTPNPDRNHAAFLCRFGRITILLDAGEAVARSYKATGLDYNLIDAICLSHMHADHFGGLFMLIQGFWLEGRRKDLPVYLPEPAIKPLRQMLQAAFLFDELLPFRLSLNPLNAAVPITIGQAPRTLHAPALPHASRSHAPTLHLSTTPSLHPPVQLTPFPTSHLANLHARFGAGRPTQFQAHSFLLQTPRRRLAYSGDLGKPDDLAPLLAQPLDLLICELAHFHPQEMFHYLQGRPVKHAVWVHLGPQHRQHAPQIRRLAAHILPAMTHTFPKDGAEIPF